MRQAILVGLIGDYDETVSAHQAIPIALQLAADSTAVEIQWQWIPTEEVRTVARISKFDGLWCVPASPYRNMEGALLAIQYARETSCPFLGTCGGFQHVVVEYARNVLNWADATHAEVSPDAARPVIAPLACELVEAMGAVHFVPGSHLARAYGSEEATEGYHCRYGVNPEFQKVLLSGPLRTAAIDTTDEVRGVELDGHPFFVATLFQPERRALRGQLPPLVASFVGACSSDASQQPNLASGSARPR
jgi:CTP synthase (UTP-ammonia lyase)